MPRARTGSADVSEDAPLVSAVQATRARVLCEVTPRVPWPRTEYVDFEDLVRRRRKRGDAFRDAEELERRPAHVRALLELVAERRAQVHEVLLDVAAATTRYASVLESLNESDRNPVELLESYLGLLMRLLDLQDTDVRNHEPEILLHNFATSWSGVLSVEQIPVSALRTEVVCAFIAAAAAQAFMARFEVDEMLHKTNTDFVSQKDLDEALLSAAKGYRKAAGIARSAAAWALRHNVAVLGGVSTSIQDACSDLVDSFLVAAQALCAASFACCKADLRDMKMAALMCETSASALLQLHHDRKRRRLPRRFSRDAAAVMLGFYYLCQAEAALLESRGGPWAIFTWLSALCFRHATAKHSAWLHLQPLVKSDVQIYELRRRLPDDALSWKHAMHGQVLGAEPFVGPTTPLEKGVAVFESVGLLVEPTDFRVDTKAAQAAETDRAEILTLRESSSRTLLTQRTSLEVAREASASRQGQSVELWKYGIERLGPCHHRMAFEDHHHFSDQGRASSSSPQSPTSPSRVSGARHVLFVRGQTRARRITSAVSSDESDDDDRDASLESDSEDEEPRPKLPAASYIRYNAYTGVAEKIYQSETGWRPRQSLATEVAARSRTEAPCGVCERHFAVDALVPCATKRGVSKLRSLWGVLQKDAKVRAHALVHTTVRVCVFCEQFFKVPFDLLRPPHKVEATVLRPTETQQDRDIETMILDSIQSMTEDSFKSLSAAEREGILSGGAALSKLAEIPGMANLALNRYATQSSTLADGDQSCALNAVDDNLFGNPACTKKESEPWWQVDLCNLANVHAVRIWTGEQRVRARIMHVMIARTPFTDGMTLAQAVEHAQAHHKFGFASRVLEWCTQPDSTTSGLRGRYVRVQLEAIDDRLEILQCQVLGHPVLRRLTQSKRGISRKRSSMISRRRSSSAAIGQQLSTSERVALRMRTFQFSVRKHNRLDEERFARVCPLLQVSPSAGKEAHGPKMQGPTKVDALLQACKDGYENEEIFDEFVNELESAVRSKIHTILSSLDSLQDVRGLALRDRHRASLGTADSAVLANWQFEELQECFTQCLPPSARGDLRAPGARIESTRVAGLFKVGRPAHAYVENCCLLSNASAAGKLTVAAELFAQVGHILSHGVDWCAFLLFVLCQDQLVRAQRDAFRALQATNAAPNDGDDQNRGPTVAGIAGSKPRRPLSAPVARRDAPSTSTSSVPAFAVPEVAEEANSKRTKHRLPARLVPLAPRESDCAMCGHDFKTENLCAAIPVAQARQRLNQWRGAARLDTLGLQESHVTNLARRLVQARPIQICKVCHEVFGGDAARLAQRVPRAISPRKAHVSTVEECLKRLELERREQRSVREMCRSVGIPLLKAQTRVARWTRLNRTMKIASVTALRLQWWWRRVRLRWARLPRPPRPKSCEERMELILHEMEYSLDEQQRDERDRRQRAWRAV